MNENSVSLGKNLVNEIVINGNEHTIDNPKLVEFFLSFEGRNTFTGVVKDKDVIAHYVNGELHRDNGPAVIDSYGNKEWLFHGKYYGSNGDFTNESWIAYVATPRLL